jgi:hydroxyethylthiazole kinase
MITLADVHALHQSLRQTRPLVHNITNYVAMTISANVLLAVGASPAMVHAEEEVEEFSRFSSALVVNIGTLSPAWIRAMKLAAASFSAQGKPWVLDPVGVGATTLRNTASADLVALRPTIIRGNASEIMALAGVSGAAGKGVDSTAGSDAALSSGKALAQASGAVVAITGEVDYVTDGTRTVAITGGHELMPLSTALGCSLSAVVAAFASQANAFDATVAAHAVYGAAGKIAGERVKGPGFLPAELCDALHALDLQGLAANTSLSEI